MANERKEPLHQTTGLRVLVCGGRNYSDNAKVWDKLNLLHIRRGIGVVIHGAQRGADQLGEYWAKANDVLHIPFKPDWDAYGPAAGPIRNKRMLDEGKPDLVIAFPGGKGTADMIWQATERGIPVEQVS